MIESEIRAYLAAVLAPVPVYLETPENVPEKYVLIERTGGGKENYLYSSTFAVQSISAASLYEAAELNEEVIAELLSMEGGIVSECRLNSTYNFTNESLASQKTKEYRYQAVFQIYHF